MDSSNHLGTVGSSRRFKDDIEPMGQASEAILALKPITFRYKKEIDPAGASQFGLVAEEVEKVNPDLVVRDKNGEIYTVRYDAVNAMLLNEFLKEHRHVQELEVNAARQQKQIDALAVDLQKVSAQLELSKAETKTVLNNH
jgi:Chaperone of endosialidase